MREPEENHNPFSFLTRADGREPAEGTTREPLDGLIGNQRASLCWDALGTRHAYWVGILDGVGLDEEATDEQREQYYAYRWTQILERWQPE